MSFGRGAGRRGATQGSADGGRRRADHRDRRSRRGGPTSRSCWRASDRFRPTTPCSCGRASTARSTRSPSRRDRSSTRATFSPRSTPARSRPLSTRPSRRRRRTKRPLANAKLDLTRYATLAKQNFATQQQLDTQNSLVNQLTATIAADAATIDAARVQLDYTTIRAPITGRAGFRLIDEGNLVNAGQQTGIVSIAQLQPIAVIFTEPQDYVDRINQELARGAPEVTVLNADGAEIATGKLTISDNQVDLATGTIRLKAEFANTDNALWPGLAVTTRLQLGVMKNVVVVPADTVQHGDKGPFVYVVGDDNRAAVRPVKVATAGRYDGGDRRRPQGRRSGRDDGRVPAAARLPGVDRRRKRELRPMFGGISAPFIHRPVATTLIMVAIFLVGLVAFPSLPVAPAAAGRLSDHLGFGVAARRLARNHGDVRRAAARTTDRPDPGRLPDDLDELARRDRDHGPVRSRPQHRRRRQRHPGGDQRGFGPVAEGPAEPADLSQGQPVRHAHPDPVGRVRRRPDHRRRRCGGEHPRPAHQPDLGRVPGAGRRPADAGDPDPDRPGEAGREEPPARGRAGADRHRDGRQPERRDHRSEAEFHDLRQRPADDAPNPGTT